ncbi:high affinity methionine permease [Coleophoma cylindrospora]|uniref:High affinity methionine permease n=1 Tax=Coleophoma cylindrospora TaxID=1849047 RepID=A0A3D8QP32_9HELO|nr:high affinity methionine permease [Coleophoma cylindrospora]
MPIGRDAVALEHARPDVAAAGLTEEHETLLAPTPEEPEGGDESHYFDGASDDDTDIEEVKDLDLDPVLSGIDNVEEAGLGRHLGVTSATLLGISQMVGTGIFSTPSSITMSVGSVGASLILWVIGLLLSFCGLFIWLELACIFPISGGEKVYLEKAYPRPKYLTSIIFAIYAVVLSSSAGGCIVFAENIVLAAGFEPRESVMKVIAILAMVGVTLMHSLVPRTGVHVMNSLAIIKILILLFLITTGIIIFFSGIPSVPEPLTSFKTPFANSSTSIYDYTIALFKVLSSFGGWQGCTSVMSEVRNPVRTVRIAGPLSLAIVGILYLLANITYFAAATPIELSSSGVTVAAFFMGKVFGTTAQRSAAGFVALSALGNIMSGSFGMARVDQELAKEGMLPASRVWARNLKHNQSPAAALGLVCLTTALTVAIVPFGDAYNFMLDVGGYPSALIGLLVALGLFILRSRPPFSLIPRPFTAWRSLSILFLFAQVLLLAAPIIPPKEGRGDTALPYWAAPLVSVLVLSSGVLYWAIWQVSLPKLGQFVWERVETKLDDGTALVVWKKKKTDDRSQYELV